MTFTLPHRSIKSFVNRNGRQTPRQQKALETLTEIYSLDPKQGILDLDALFQRHAPTLLEIGFGMGKSLIHMAKLYPESNFIGIDIYLPGIGTVLADIEEQHLSNIRLLRGDATLLVSQCFADQSLDAIQIFFPDPWPKQRHRKRRLIQPEFIDLLTKKLKIGAQLHLATDWQDYAIQMLNVLSACKSLQNQAGERQFSSDRGQRPLTKYELRGQRLGHQVWDLLFIKSI